jgi:hypothetical protein
MASKTLGNGSARARPTATPMAIFMPSRRIMRSPSGLLAPSAHAGGDFVRALSHGVSNETVDSDAGEDESEKCGAGEHTDKEWVSLWNQVLRPCKAFESWAVRRMSSGVLQRKRNEFTAGRTAAIRYGHLHPV